MMTRTKNLLAVFLMLGVSLLAGCASESDRKTVYGNPNKVDHQKAIDTYVTIAYGYIEQREYELAMRNIQNALEMNDRAPGPLTALGVLYQRQGENERARMAYEDALKKNPDYSTGHVNYGQFLFTQGNIEEACTHFAKAAADPVYDRRTDAYFNLGICHMERGDPVLAEDAFTRCLALDHAYEPAYYELANISFIKQDYVMAKKLLDTHAHMIKKSGRVLSPKAIMLNIKVARRFGDMDRVASLELFLRNVYPNSPEYKKYMEDKQR
jgi:type IV pilus assembly protein PilF